jgi:hypothetical protein
MDISLLSSHLWVNDRKDYHSMFEYVHLTQDVLIQDGKLLCKC